MSNGKLNPNPDPIRLLFVDDEKDFVNVIAKRLSKRGFDVTKTFSGPEALQAMRKSDFDIVVLDLKMEEMDGMEIFKILGKMAPGLPVIMLTGHGSETSARECVKSGVTEYLTKPCDFEELVGKIKQVLKR